MGKGYNPNRDKNGRFAEGKRKVEPTQVNPTLPQLHKDVGGKKSSNTKPTLSDIVSSGKVLPQKSNQVFTNSQEKGTPNVFPKERGGVPIDIQDRMYQAKKVGQNPVSLAILSKDLNPDIRATIALRDDIGEEILEDLAEDNDSLVLANVARNKKSPPTALNKVFEKCENNPKLWAVKCVLAEHANLPKDKLVELTQDSDRLVASVAFKRLAKMKESSRTN